MKYKSVLIFFVAFSAVLLYSAVWAKIFAGYWPNILSVVEMPFAAIIAFLAALIFIVREKFAAGNGRSYFIYGFLGLIALLLYVIAVEKYSFVFLQKTWIFNLHPLEPIIFTISVSSVIQGMAKALRIKI